MKLTSLLHLTDQHHFAVIRHFGLSPIDFRMITDVYQPIIGAFAASLYNTLYSRFSTNTVGCSSPAALSSLFLICGLEPNEQGRKRLVDETSKLEAVGLLRSYRRVGKDGEVERYDFHLEKPYSPVEFFDVHHLWILLNEKLGSKNAESVRSSFFTGDLLSSISEDDGKWEDISAPFYEVFRLSVPAGSEQSVREAAAALEPAASAVASEYGRDGFQCSELMRRFPRSSPNRRYVERLQQQPEMLAQINYFAGKFELTLKETVSLLDEEGMFLQDGRLDGERFEARASELFLRSEESERGRERLRSKQQAEIGNERNDEGTDASIARERDVAPAYWLDVPEQFAGKCDAQQYNSLLANAPYTRVLKWFFHPAAVPGNVQKAFLALNVNSRLPDEVINVMIHYIRTNNLDWTRGFLEAIGANVAGKHIRTFESAVKHFRNAEQVRNGGASVRGGAAGDGEAAAPRRQTDNRRGRPSKPVIPVAKKSEGKSATDADIRRILEKAKQLKQDR